MEQASQTAARRETHEQTVQSKRVQQIATLLLDARQKLSPITDLDPALQPVSLDEAYAIQDAMAARLGAVGGWKIGAPSPEATPRFAPMPLKLSFVRSGENIASKHSRMRGIEAEIGFVLHRDLPIREERYAREEILSALSVAHPVIEILESAYVDPDAVNPLAMTADLQMNGGFVHGPACDAWKTIDVATEELEITVDGFVRWQGVGKNPNGPDILRLLDYLANEAQYRTGGLQAGQWITTGSWMGKLLVDETANVTVSFQHFGSVAVTYGK